MVGLVRYLNRQAHSLDSFGSFVDMVRSFDNKIVHSSPVRPILVDFSHVALLEYFKIADHRAQKKALPEPKLQEGINKKGRPKPPEVTYLRLLRPQTRDRER